MIGCLSRGSSLALSPIILALLRITSCIFVLFRGSAQWSRFHRGKITAYMLRAGSSGMMAGTDTLTHRVKDKRNQSADKHVCVCARADFSPSFGVYYSGCSVSRDASTRAVHPHYDSSVIHGPAT